MRGCGFCRGPHGCASRRRTRPSPACTSKATCSRSRLRTATAATWRTSARWRSSRRAAASCGATCATTPTGRCTTSPACATPAATWSASCRTRSAATPRSWAARMEPVSFTRWRLDMRRSTLWMCALLATATLGCRQVSEQYAKIKQTIAQKIAERRGRSATPQPVQQPTPLPPEPAPPPTPSAEVPARPPRQVPERPAASRDVPYSSVDTGTIAPGMGEKDVYSLWGPPIAVRHQGAWTYLFFRNGCEYTCGTEDVVTLQNGQVVDAVLRWPGHGYSGQSSSPAATKPHGRPGGDTLVVKPQGT